jgi:phenylacetate-CoA ligase
MHDLRCDHLSRADLDRLQADGVAALLADLLPGNAFYARKFAGLSLSRLRIEDLPFTTRAELTAAQAAAPPHGGLISEPFARYTRMHQTSGTSGRPLRWYDTAQSWGVLLDTWLELFRLMGLRADDRFFFPFSFGPFLGFWSAFDAAQRWGCLCLPGGGMSSTARLRFLLDNAATVVFCTPSYALHLAEVALREGVDLAGSTVRALVVAGEPGGNIPATRARIEAGWGARVFDHNGMTETGPLGIECADTPGSLTLLESVCLPEVIDPVTGRAVPPGVEGELVVTTFRRTACPLVRYRTGDLVRAMPSSTALLTLSGGLRGRVDDMVVVRGNNLHPAVLQDLLHRFAEVAEYQVEIDQTAALAEVRVRVEPAPGVEAAGLLSRIDRTIQDELLFRIEILAATPGSLPRAEMKARRWVRKTALGQPP